MHEVAFLEKIGASSARVADTSESVDHTFGSVADTPSELWPTRIVDTC